MVFSASSPDPDPESGLGLWSCSWPPTGTDGRTLIVVVVDDDDVEDGADDDVLVGLVAVVVEGFTFSVDLIVDVVEVVEGVADVAAASSDSSTSSSPSLIGSSIKTGISVRDVMPLALSVPDTDNVS